MQYNLKNVTNEVIYNTEIDSQAEKKKNYGYQRGKRVGGIN